MCNPNCNCIDCIWDRLIENQGKAFLTKTRKNFSYKVENNTIHFIPGEISQEKLRSQTKTAIENSLSLRLKDYCPSDYGNGASSYRWGILNDHRIWK